MNWKWLSSAVVAVLCQGALGAQEPSLAFLKEFALAEDRDAVAGKLLAGSEAWYEFQVLRAHQRGELERARAVLGEWSGRHGRSAALTRAENRDLLLGFARDPRATFAALRQRLGLSFEVARTGGAGDPSLPIRLDPAQLSEEAWIARALARNPDSLDGFRDSALAGLVEDGRLVGTDSALLRALLVRRPSPDLPGLPALIVRDLEQRPTKFGALAIHGDLRLEALEECARLRPALLAENGFVEAWLARLAPGADVDLEREPDERTSHLARLRSFSERLPASMNSLKANVLYRTLEDELRRNALVREDLLAYLALPRARDFTSTPLRAGKGEEVDPSRSFGALRPIGDDEALLRACFTELFVRESDVTPFARHLEASWLRELLAETRLVVGDPDAARWAAMLPPERLRALEERVELAFPATRRSWFAADEPVVLELDTKNVPELLVRVFALDAFRALSERLVEIDEHIALDGLVASVETRHRYAEPALRRVRRRFELPTLSGPGVYVVEFVGAGQVSRALVRKGHLTAVQRVGAAGHVFQVFDERGEEVKDAHLWFGGRDWLPDERGLIRLPFSTEPGEKKIVLHQGQRASLASFEHAAESYALEARAFVPREALIAEADAPLLLRPRLTLAGERVSLKLLEEPVLTLVVEDLDGRRTSQEVRGLALADERELVHVLRVPARLAALHVSLRGRVRALDGTKLEVASESASVQVNGIDALAEFEQPLLLRTPRGYVAELRGKDGEPLAGRALKVELTHRDFTQAHVVTLQSDAAGRIELGELAGIERVRLTSSDAVHGTHVLRESHVAYPEEVHLVAGETLRLPYLGRATRATRAAFSLQSATHDEFAKLALADGFLVAAGLEPGDHRLRLHESGQALDVRVTRGARRGDWLVGPTRVLEATPNRALYLHPPRVEGDALVVRVDGARDSTRVLLTAQRYLHGNDAPGWARAVESFEVGASGAPPSAYEVGRALSPELRYVLERRAAPHFPGNLLPRPSLLLNPLDLALAVNSSVSFDSAFSTGSGVGGRFGGKKGLRAAGGSSATQNIPQSANLDFLPRAAALLANRKPDAQGLVRVPLAELGAGPLVTVTVLEGNECLQRVHVLEEPSFAPRARRLARALPAEEHVVEERRIEFVPGGTPLVLDATRTARAATLGTLADVFRVWMAGSGDADLARFEFVTRWASLTRAEKLALYDEHACHELSFFVHEKDPEFFAEVVRPYLTNKLEKTFLDRWLLGEDLAAFLEPWAFDDLNWIERILLAQRVAPERAEPIRRALREAGALLPAEREHERRAFELALDSASLAEGAEKGKKAGAYRGPGDSVPPGRPAAPAAEEAVPSSEDAANLAALGYGGGEEDAEDEPGEPEELLREAERRDQAPLLYRTPVPSRRYVEHQYWHRVRAPGDGFAALVRPSAFWREYATAPLDRSFVSPAVLTADGSFLERLFALAVLDLPFEAGPDETRVEGERSLVTRASARLSVRLERTPVAPTAGSASLLLGENYLRLDERTIVVEGEVRDRYVEGEFLVATPYLCRVLVTNTSSAERTVELVLQIPEGAVPLAKGHWTRGETLTLAAFSTRALEYAFYFPAAGRFAHYPAQAAEKGRLLAAGEARTLAVVTRPSQLDTSSWEHVSQAGTTAQVLEFLARANLGHVDLGRIAWRLKEKAFQAALLAELRARHHWSELVWSWALQHEDAQGTREYLERHATFLADCDGTLETPLLALDPVRRHAYRHLEIEPLILARVHRRADELDDGSDLARQYRTLLDSLALRRELAAEDWLAVSYFQLLQGRVPEALASFGQVEPDALAARLQYDYLSAYLAFHTGDLAAARAVQMRHAEHPLAHWRARFTALGAQLDELEGGRPVQAGVEPAQADPVLELVVEGRALRVRYRDLARCELGFSPLDVELAFTVRPFADGGADPAGYVLPRARLALELPAGKNEVVVPVPAGLERTDLFVEARASGLSRRCTLLASALDVRYLESRGELAVAEAATGKPLAAVYVKCFARLPDGSVRFHKDGYTDLRGRFDYVSLSDDPDLGATRFAVLVQSEELGADLREVAPPAR